MTEKKIAKTTDKKVYKRPALVKLVESGKVMPTYCSSFCGPSVVGDNSTCGHY